MSILIKGMKMPACCRDCACYKHKYDSGYYNYDLCDAVGIIFNEKKFDFDPFSGRLENCPLVEVPTPHGRLIDADAIEYTHAIARCIKDGHNWNELCVTADEICDMPTIIEAEEGNEE